MAVFIILPIINYLATHLSKYQNSFYQSTIMRSYILHLVLALQVTLGLGANSSHPEQVTPKRRSSLVKSRDSRSRDKELVCNVHQHARLEKAAYHRASPSQQAACDAVTGRIYSLKKARDRTAKMTGTSIRTLDRFRSQEIFRSHMSPMKRAGRRRLDMPDWTLPAIRTIITHMYGYKGGSKADCVYPSVENVRAKFYEVYPGEPALTYEPSKGDIPIVGKTKFRKLIKAAGYRFVRADETGRAVIASRQAAQLDLLVYLREVYRLRYSKDISGKLTETNVKFFYMDETWVNRNHQRGFTWKRVISGGSYADEDGKVNELPAHYEGDFDLPTGKGERLIIIHFMSEDGLLKGAEKVFKGEKVTDDYHKEMNGKHFEEHLKNKVLPLLPRGSVLVIDKASYHNRITEETKAPKKGAKKADIVKWLSQKDLPSSFPKKDALPGYTNSELLDFAARLNIKKEYIVDRILKEKDIRVLRLPTKHCELNPIELVWAKIKGRIAELNTERHCLSEMEKMVLQSFDEVTPEECKKIVGHVKKIEQSKNKAELIMDTVVNDIIIDLEEDDSESDSDSDDGDEDGYDDAPPAKCLKMTKEAEDELLLIKRLMAQESLVFGTATFIKKATINCGCKTTQCVKGVCSCLAAKTACTPICSCKNCLNQGSHEAMSDEAGINDLASCKKPAEQIIQKAQHKPDIVKCGCKTSGCDTTQHCRCKRMNQYCSTHCKCKICKNGPQLQVPAQPTTATVKMDKEDENADTNNVSTPLVVDLDPPPPPVIIVGRNNRPALAIRNVPSDGACLFSAVGCLFEQLVGHMIPNIGDSLRQMVANEILSNPERYSDNLRVERATPQQYATRIQQRDFWGGHLDLVIIAEYLNIRLHVLYIHPQHTQQPFSITSVGNENGTPVALMYYNDHYQYVVRSGRDNAVLVTLSELEELATFILNNQIVRCQVILLGV